MHLGKHEHTLLAFSVLPTSLVRSCFPGRSVQGRSCWPLGCLLVIQPRLPELALAGSVTFFDQVDAGCNITIDEL